MQNVETVCFVADASMVGKVNFVTSVCHIQAVHTAAVIHRGSAIVNNIGEDSSAMKVCSCCILTLPALIIPWAKGLV